MLANWEDEEKGEQLQGEQREEERQQAEEEQVQEQEQDEKQVLLLTSLPPRMEPKPSVMDADQAANVSFFDFVGGVQLLQGEETRAALPVILIGICVSGAIGNLLVLLIFAHDFRQSRGSEVKALLASLASTDLSILLLCAPVRAVTYYRRTWTLGAFVCNTADWFQHACVAAKTFTLAAATRASHTAVSPPHSAGPTWVRGALAFIWTGSMVLPVPQLLFASVVKYGSGDAVCISQVPACAADFMTLFSKVYPCVVFVLPVVIALGHHTRALHAAVNYAAEPEPEPEPKCQSKVTLVLLCLSGALGLMLLPEWATFTWARLGSSRPPVGLVLFAQVLLYASSALSPVILMIMYDDVRQGLVTMWFVATCRGSRQPPLSAGNKCVKAEGNGTETGTVNVVNELSSEAEGEKTFPDVEHFWTGRRNTQVEEEQDPVPWEREQKML